MHSQERQRIAGSFLHVAVLRMRPQRRRDSFDGAAGTRKHVRVSGSFAHDRQPSATTLLNARARRMRAQRPNHRLHCAQRLF